MHILIRSGLLLLLSFTVQAAELAWSITAEEWAQPRSGAVLVEYPALRQALQAMEGMPDARLLLQYPGGEAGVLWANELRDWLVSLGLPLDRIVLQPGLADHDRIRLLVDKQ